MQIYHTWGWPVPRTATGTYEQVRAQDGRVSFVIPELITERSHANHIGNDVAFILTPE